MGPDNGLLTLAARRCQEKDEFFQVVDLDKPEYWLEDVSNIFHGRDIFSPVGAYLAAGIPIEQLGTTILDPIWLDVPSPIRFDQGVAGQVIHQDHFGNLSTNIPVSLIRSAQSAMIRAGNRTISGISKTFGDRQPGELTAIIDSSGYLAVCEVNGSAAQTLGLTVGAAVSITWSMAENELSAL